jgi:hypothetical protein
VDGVSATRALGALQPGFSVAAGSMAAPWLKYCCHGEQAVGIDQ